MVSLVPKSPCADLLPLAIAETTVSEVVPEAITLVAPFKGKKKTVSDALKAEVGVGLPAPGRMTGKQDARCIWVGPEQALVIGPAVSPDGAAVTDQSDGFAVIQITGPMAANALARLTPIDLRRDHFKPGHTARTLLNHMTCSITRLGAASFEILVFRSMAKTAVHELTEALKLLEGRAKLS